MSRSKTHKINGGPHPCAGCLGAWEWEGSLLHWVFCSDVSTKQPCHLAFPCSQQGESWDVFRNCFLLLIHFFPASELNQQAERVRNRMC